MQQRIANVSIIKSDIKQHSFQIIKQSKIMKTSIIKVHDMLSVLSVEEVEKRIGEVAGVESVTVNFAAENATVRYDETRLEATDIKSAVRQKSNESDETDQPEVKPLEDKPEAPATAPAVKPPEEKDKTETIPPANKEKAEEHAGHKMDEMSKDKAEDSKEPPSATKADKL